MAPTILRRPPVIITLPGQYAKFLTALIGEAIGYLQLYGTTWHLQAALVMAGAALAVLGVPNIPKPLTAAKPPGVFAVPPPSPAQPLPGNVTVTSPPPP